MSRVTSAPHGAPLELVKQKLAALPYAHRLMVFGSWARGADSPRDVDVFVDLRGRESGISNPYAELLQIGRRHYGCLDPFLRTDQGLFVRNAESTDWVRARGARAIGLAMDADGVPLRTLLERDARQASVAAVRGPVDALSRTMRRAGWEIEYIDLDLASERPKAAIRVHRDDGRFLIATVDAIGRASIERFQREKGLSKPGYLKGRHPLQPMVEDVFLGRDRFPGARSMLRGLVHYLADNASHPLPLDDMRAAWRAVMGAPAVHTALPGCDAGGAEGGSPPPMTESQAFRQWFGESKVRGPDGQPLVVYHGTRARVDFAVFSPDSHFGSVQAADVKASNGGVWGPGRIMPVYLSIKNPKRVRDVASIGWGQWADTVEQAKAEGYDGIVYLNEAEGYGTDSWIAFEPEQVKSAVGNCGDFEPGNPDIRCSLESGDMIDAEQAWERQR